MNPRKLCSRIVWAALMATVTCFTIGCGQDNNRVPTTTEIKAADSNRLSYIDKLNIPESQKAMMKSHLGGAPVADPAEAAKAKAGGAPTGSR